MELYKELDVLWYSRTYFTIIEYYYRLAQREC